MLYKGVTAIIIAIVHAATLAGASFVPGVSPGRTCGGDKASSTKFSGRNKQTSLHLLEQQSDGGRAASMVMKTASIEDVDTQKLVSTRGSFIEADGVEEHVLGRRPTGITRFATKALFAVNLIWNLEAFLVYAVIKVILSPPKAILHGKV